MARRQWFDFPDTTTPLAASLLNDLESRKPEVEYLKRNVMDYGADPTGIADSTVAFNAAAGNYVNVEVPEGEYLLDDFVMPRASGLVGHGQSTTLKAAPGATYVVRLEATTDSRISDLCIDGNSQASRGLLISGGNGSSQRQLLDKVNIRSCSVGLYIPSAAPINQADKNTYLGCQFNNNVLGYWNESNNGQQQLFLGGGFDTNTTAVLLSGAATMTCVGMQFQSNGTGFTFGGGVDSLALIDCIFETSNPTGADIDGTGGWPGRAVFLQQCVLQSAPNTVKLPGGGVLRSIGTRFNNGNVTGLASDACFYDEFSLFAGGAAWVPFDTTNRRFKIDTNGLQLTSNPNATTLEVARGKMQFAGVNANLGAMTGIFPYSQAIDLPSQAANSTSELDFGAASIALAVGDLCVVIGAPSLENGLVVSGLPVSTGNNLRLRVTNHTAGAIDAASRTFYFLIIRF